MRITSLKLFMTHFQANTFKVHYKYYSVVHFRTQSHSFTTSVEDLIDIEIFALTFLMLAFVS